MTKKYTEGQFCWSELATTDCKAAKTFYSHLFHWKITDLNFPDGGSYSTASIQGLSNCALYEMGPEERKQGLPSHWREYISVHNINETTSKARQFGATVLVEPMDVMTFGRMAVISDPTGAVVSFWQAIDSTGTDTNESMHGAPCWFELMTTDVEKAKSFYASVLGWEYHETNSAIGTRYTRIHTKGGQQMVGGMMTMPPQMKGIPSHWSHYFSCNDVDVSTQIAKELGAKICMEPTDIPGIGRFSTCFDPTGASFCLFNWKQNP